MVTCLTIAFRQFGVVLGLLCSLAEVGFACRVEDEERSGMMKSEVGAKAPLKQCEVLCFPAEIVYFVCL